MNHYIIENFLNSHFAGIEGCILFGSYTDNPTNANDIDLLLISNKFSYSSKESFYFEGIKINTIKFNITEVFSILAKHYQQGDFYRLVFSKGIVIVDKNKDLQFIKRYIISSYPQQKQDVLAFSLNETLYNLSEYKGFLSTSISQIEFHVIIAKIVSILMDYFLFLNGIYHFKSEKIKSRHFNIYFPTESKKILKLISITHKNNQKKCLLELNSFINEYHIPLENKYSNDLIFDDYLLPNLILFVENLFSFQELKEIIAKIKAENIKLQFYVYQVDEDHQEKKGCYIVFDNRKLEFETEKQKWLVFFQNMFSKHQYSFPYNNIFCYPEIKFIGKKNEKTVNQFLTNFTNAINSNDSTKEAFLASLLPPYLSKINAKMEDVYNFYLGKLNSKTHSSNYLTQKRKETEYKFLEVNSKNEKTLLTILKKTETIELNLNFRTIPDEPIWFHFQVIDRLLSILLKNDFEKLFYIYCLKKLHE
jgi:hypothetical protein